MLLAQLGTPAAPTVSAVRRYLAQFLSDPRVVEMNRLLWKAILHAVVLRTRPRRSAALYQRIWRAEGSPLLLHTRRQSQLLEAELRSGGADADVTFGMRYGEPALPAALDSLIAKGCRRILVFPLFPQYAGATTGSCSDLVFAHLGGRRWIPALRIAAPYFRHPAYIDALAGRIKGCFSGGAPPERLILSYHGLPLKYVRAGDPYCCMCSETTARLAEKLGIDRERVVHAYQSRFGPEEWLSPSAESAVREMAAAGVKRAAIACPGFAADCLETLQEIGQELRDLFLRLGGAELTLIPCLNDDPLWIRALAGMVREELGAWLAPSGGRAVDACPSGC